MDSLQYLLKLYQQRKAKEEKESRRCIPVEIFVSWSGAKSKEIAELLKIWLHNVLQSLKVWVSTENIDTGAMWFAQICEQIKKVNNSIIVVTKENKDNPWIMFEAGALCRGDDNNRVNVLLVDVEPEDIRQPLASFNMVKADKDGMKKMMRDINKRATAEHPNSDQNLEDVDLCTSFEKWYSEFKEKFAEIMEKYPADDDLTPKTKMEHMQEEILASTRTIEHALIELRKNIDVNTLSNIGSDFVKFIIAAALSKEKQDKTAVE